MILNSVILTIITIPNFNIIALEENKSVETCT